MSNKPAKKHHNPNTTELLVWGIPRNTKNRFKAACVRRGLTMRDMIIRLITSFGNHDEQ